VTNFNKTSGSVDAMNEAIQHFRDKLAFETDAWDLNELIHAGSNVVIIDARSEAAFAQEHIPRALNLPHRKMNHDTTEQFRRDALYITYCDGIGCNASTKGALKLSELGFQVKELIGGLNWWKRDGYPTESAMVAIDQLS
jgi:rhodanese-related sulfurtransferase